MKLRTLAALKAKRVSFDFVETPLSDVLAFLADISGFSFAIDARRVPDPPQVTLKVNDVALASALAWICRLGDLDYVIGDRHVVLTTKKGIYELDEKLIRVYDVSELIRPAINHNDPRKARRKGSGREVAALVRRAVAPGTWGKTYGTSATYRAGLLTVVHIHRVQRVVAALLDGLR